jgi:transglycosylase-like protein/Big-like domain-containing protein
VTALATLAAVVALGTAPPPPTVSSSLADGQTVSGAVTWTATPSEPLQRVEFVVDGWVRQVVQSPPYAFRWDTTRESDGPHVLDLWAVTTDGRVATARVTVTVSNPFALAFRGLEAGRRVAKNTRWGAATSGLHADWVEFLVDGRLRGADDSPPFAVDWDTTQEMNGRHTITLWAVATNGRVASVSLPVVVENVAVQTGIEARALVTRYRDETWHWDDLMRIPRAQPAAAGDSHAELARWRRLAADARARAARPPHWREFLCIHRYEGAWDANTGNGYYGGLQMNLDFIRTYGPELYRTKGLAHRWTPLEQIWVAERAWPRRGFEPWPQTAHMCGLI